MGMSEFNAVRLVRKKSGGGQPPHSLPQRQQGFCLPVVPDQASSNLLILRLLDLRLE